MPAYSVDFTNVQTLNMNPLPAGQYYVQVVACNPKSSKAGKPMFEWQYRVVDGEFENRRIYQNTMLQQESLWKLKQNLVGLGYSEADLEGNIQIDPEEMFGLECYAVVTQRTWEGQVRNDVQRLISIDEYNMSHGGVITQTDWNAGAEAPDPNVEWNPTNDIPFGTEKTGTADKTAATAAGVAAPATIAEAQAAAAGPEDDDDDDEEGDEDEDDEPEAKVELAPTKAAVRLAETYNVSLDDVYKHSGEATISRQHVLDYVATLAPAGEDEE
jgi:hypothetical protein